MRSANGAIYKVKPIITLDLVVLGYAEGTGDRKGMIRELLFGYAVDKSTYQLVTHCGNGFSDEQRKKLFQDLAELRTESSFIEVSSARVAFNMIRPELVAEVSCLDIAFETSDGIIRKATIGYGKKGYHHTGMGASVSLTSPVFKRFRDDKKVSTDDTGYEQLSAWLPETSEADAQPAAASEIVSRHVFTKKGKGGTAVRKFTILKTNKEDSGRYAPFVVVYTDFSGGRKTPLEQELYLCASQKEADKKLAELREENIKKGWEAYS